LNGANGVFKQGVRGLTSDKQAESSGLGLATTTAFNYTYDFL